APGGGFVNTPGGAQCLQPTLPSGPVSEPVKMATLVQPGTLNDGNEEPLASNPKVSSPSDDPADNLDTTLAASLSSLSQSVEPNFLQTRLVGVLPGLRSVNSSIPKNSEGLAAISLQQAVTNAPNSPQTTVTQNIGTLPA